MSSSYHIHEGGAETRLLTQLDDYIVASVRMRSPDAIPWYTDYDQYFDEWYTSVDIHNPSAVQRATGYIPLVGRLYVDNAIERKDKVESAIDRLRQSVCVGNVTVRQVDEAMIQACDELVADPPEGLAVSPVEFESLVRTTASPLILPTQRRRAA